MHNPRIDHFNALKRIILYVKGTLVMDFTFIPLLSPLLSLTLMQIGRVRDIPWFHGIFNAFFLSLVCVQKPFCIDFYVSLSLFAGNLSKDERGSF